jgi:hypothetical protein
VDEGSFVIRQPTVQIIQARHHPEKDTLRRHGVGFQVGQAHAQYAHIVRINATFSMTGYYPVLLSMILP